MRRSVLIVATMVMFAAKVFPQPTYVVVDPVRLPAESYVGDAVELRYTVRTPAVPVVPDEIPQPKWGNITSVRILPGVGEFELRLTVVPYEPGTLTLPRLDLGGVRIEGLSLNIESVLAPGEVGLRAAHGPRRLPGTRAAFLLFGFALSFVIALAAYLAGPGRSHIRGIMRRYRARIPYRKLLACVQLLQRDINRYTMREFYIALVQEIQSFMTSRVEQNCMAATSTELIRILPKLDESCGAVAGTATPLEEVFQAADGAKFAHRTVRRKKRSRHLKIVQAVVVELEAHRKKLRWSGHVAREQKNHVGV
jgi:hypothetical protein